MKFTKIPNNKRVFAVALLISVAAILCFCFAGCSFTLSCAGSSSSPFEDFEADYGTYTINSIDVTARVGENSEVRFREDITVYFKRPKLGIYRDLATNSGEKYRDIKIVQSEWSKVEHEDGFVRISLGKPDGSSRVTGEQKYIIEYTLILPDRDNPDDIYLNPRRLRLDDENRKGKHNAVHARSIGYALVLHRLRFEQRLGYSKRRLYPYRRKRRLSLRFYGENLSAFQGVTMRSSLPAGTISLHESSCRG